MSKAELDWKYVGMLPRLYTEGDKQIIAEYMAKKNTLPKLRRLQSVVIAQSQIAYERKLGEILFDQQQLMDVYTMAVLIKTEGAGQ